VNVKTFYSLILFSFIGASALGASELPLPYSTIKVLSEFPFGHYSAGNANQIADIFSKNDIHVVVEVGSWIGGGSTRHMGEFLKKCNGTLYAVDTWLGNITQQAGGDAYQPVLGHVYQQFLSNMIHWNLTDVVIPCRMRSLEASKALDAKPDLIYIDAEHTTEAVYEDLLAWYPFVKGHGILCGDDWHYSDVKVAVNRFALENNLRIEAIDNFWRVWETD